jgi:hypothetical protein
MAMATTVSSPIPYRECRIMYGSSMGTLSVMIFPEAGWVYGNS